MPDIPCPIAAMAAEAQRLPALVLPDGAVMAYGALDALVAGVAGALAQAGVRPGDRVGLWLEPGPRTIALLFALPRIGAVACPVSLRLPAGQVGPILARIGASALIADRPVVGPAPPRLDPSRLEPQPGGRWRGETLQADRIVSAVFTSGSSGTPKAVGHAAGHHAASARGAVAAMPLGPYDRWLLSLPLYHVGGLGVLWRCFLSGAAAVLPPAGPPLGALVAARSITHLSVVPTQLRRMFGERPQPYMALREIIVGGDGTPPGLLAEAAERGLAARASYGCTEAASTVTLGEPARPGAVPPGDGRPLPGRRVRIGEGGEIEIAGDTLSPGYIEGDSLRPLAGADGWYRTGDIGRIDETGVLHVAGRRDRRFVSGGENVHPEAIERALADLPGIEAAAVVAVPDPDYGHRPVAFLLHSDGTPPERDAIRAALDAAGTLPRFMHPARVLPWPAERGAPAMKPDRRRLAQLAAAALS